MSEHSNLFPLCRFVQGQDVGNIPIGSSGEVVVEQVVTPPSPGHDETGIRWSSGHTEPNTTPEKGRDHPQINITYYLLFRNPVHSDGDQP